MGVTPGPTGNAPSVAARRTPRAGGSQGRLRAAWSRPWVKRSVLVAGVLGALGVLLLVFAYVAVSLPKEPESAQTTVVLDADGAPRVHGARTHPDAPGLHFIGMLPTMAGMLFQINRDARATARQIGRGRGR